MNRQEYGRDQIFEKERLVETYTGHYKDGLLHGKGVLEFGNG